MSSIRFKITKEKQNKLAHVYDAVIRMNIPDMIDYLKIKNLLSQEEAVALYNKLSVKIADPVGSCVAAFQLLNEIWHCLLRDIHLLTIPSDTLKTKFPLSTMDTVILLNALPESKKELRTIGYWLQSAARWAVVAQMTDKISSDVLPDYFMDLAKLKKNLKGQFFEKLKFKGSEDQTNYACFYDSNTIETHLLKFKKAYGVSTYGEFLHVPHNDFLHHDNIKKMNLNIPDAKPSTVKVDEVFGAFSSVKAISPTLAEKPVVTEPESVKAITKTL